MKNWDWRAVVMVAPLLSAPNSITRKGMGARGASVLARHAPGADAAAFVGMNFGIIQIHTREEARKAFRKGMGLAAGDPLSLTALDDLCGVYDGWGAKGDVPRALRRLKVEILELTHVMSPTEQRAATAIHASAIESAFMRVYEVVQEQLMRPDVNVLKKLRMGILTDNARSQITSVEIPSHMVRKRIAEYEDAKAADEAKKMRGLPPPPHAGWPPAPPHAGWPMGQLAAAPAAGAAVAAGVAVAAVPTAATAGLKGGFMCREFARGQCNRGAACRFQH